MKKLMSLILSLILLISSIGVSATIAPYPYIPTETAQPQPVPIYPQSYQQVCNILSVGETKSFLFEGASANVKLNAIDISSHTIKINVNGVDHEVRVGTFTVSSAENMVFFANIGESDTDPNTQIKFCAQYQMRGQVHGDPINLGQYPQMNECEEKYKKEFYEECLKEDDGDELEECRREVERKFYDECRGQQAPPPRQMAPCEERLKQQFFECTKTDSEENCRRR